MTPAPRRRGALLLSSIAVAGVLGLLAWLRAPGGIASVRLTDGRWLRLRQVAVGTSLPISPPSATPRWLPFVPRAAYRFIPRSAWDGSISTRYSCTAAGLGSGLSNGFHVLLDGAATRFEPRSLPDIESVTIEDATGRSATSQICDRIERVSGPRYATSFSVVPRQANRLRLRVRFKQGEEAVLSFANRWKSPPVTGLTPYPLPQTVTHGESVVRLDGVSLAPTGDRIGIHPALHYEAAEPGAHPGNFSQIDFDMSDEEGNGPCLQTPGRGSAFWCVRQRLQRNYTYPFRSTDLVSVSTTLPAAGEHRDLTLPAGLLTRNVSYAGLFGPGTYTWDNGKVTAASPEFTQRRSSRNTPSWSQSSPHLVLVLGTAAARDRILSETCLIRLGTTNGFVSLGGKNGGGGTEGTSYSFQIDCSYEENSAGANLPPPGSQVEVQLITTPILTNTFVFPPSAVTR